MAPSNLLNELKTLAAHHSAAAKIAASLVKQLEGEQKKPTRGLSADVKASLIAKRNKTAFK